VNAKKTFSV